MGSCWSLPLTCQGQQVVWAKQSSQLGEERENQEEGPPHRVIHHPRLGFPDFLSDPGF